MQETRQNKIARLLQKEQRDIPAADKGYARSDGIGDKNKDFSRPQYMHCLSQCVPKRESQ